MYSLLTVDSDGFTYAHITAHQGDLQALMVLFSHFESSPENARVLANFQDRSGNTPLHLIVHSPKQAFAVSLSLSGLFLLLSSFLSLFSLRFSSLTVGSLFPG